MKTKLPESITTVEEAKRFLSCLQRNNESFHPEDDATDIDWKAIDDDTDEPTAEECEKLNDLMCDIYNLPGNDGRHSDPMVFDPCGYLLWLCMPETIEFPVSDLYDVEYINSSELFVSGWKYSRGDKTNTCTKQPFEKN